MLKEVQRGEVIVILNGTTPVAKLTAIEQSGTGTPNVGTRTSMPVQYADDAFQPLTDQELKEWGL